MEGHSEPSWFKDIKFDDSDTEQLADETDYGTSSTYMQLLLFSEIKSHMRSVCLSVCVGGSEVNSLVIVVLYPGAVQPPDSLREENTEKLQWLNEQLSMWNLILRFMNMRHVFFKDISSQ